MLVPFTLSGASVTANRLSLCLPIPPSINHQYATVNGRRILSAIGRQYKSDVSHQVLAALAHADCREGLLATLRTHYLSLSIRFHFRAPLRRDIDGGIKITQDALLEALSINDNRIVELHLYKDLGGNDPHVEVSITVTTAT